MSFWQARLRMFGAPPDAVAWVALLLGVAVALFGPSVARRLGRVARGPALAAASLAAAALSHGVVGWYLRGGPRIVDATTYWLQARALAHGLVTIPAGDAGVRGRFLLSPLDAPDRVASLFPPGWPALLAAGFVFHVPMLIGPALAAALVVATWSLARRVTGRDDAAWLAALLSVACATLRYHTADTMSHGLAALLGTSALALGWRATDAREPRARALSAAACGLALGWLFATRPVSGAAFGLMLVVAIAPRLARRDRLVAALGAAVPIALLLLEQRAATGAWLASSQSAYYAASDGPAGCFRYGFGAGIGCLHEHGDFVRTRLASGYGPLAALLVTLRRLEPHLLDVANLEPLALLVPVGALLGPRSARARTLGAAVAAIALAYAPFYFDGNYPGGGARFFADVLPLEHVLVARAVILLAERASRPIGAARAGAGLLALSLVGFALHGSHGLALLRDRDGGRPYFEPEVVARAGVSRGLLLLDSDHGFALAHDPLADDPSRALVVRRASADDRERLAWRSLGRPPTFRYAFDPTGARAPEVTPASFAPLDPAVWRFEAEVEWPARAQRGGWAEPVYTPLACASGGRALALHAERGATARVTIGLPVPDAGRWRVTPVVLTDGAGGHAELSLRTPGDPAPRARWTWAPAPAPDARCAPLPAAELELPAGEALIDVDFDASGSALDAFLLEPSAPPSAPAGAQDH